MHPQTAPIDFGAEVSFESSRARTWTGSRRPSVPSVELLGDSQGKPSSVEAVNPVLAIYSGAASQDNSRTSADGRPTSNNVMGYVAAVQRPTGDPNDLYGAWEQRQRGGELDDIAQIISRKLKQSPRDGQRDHDPSVCRTQQEVCAHTAGS